MKSLILLNLVAVCSLSAYGGTCSYGLIDSVREGVKTQVYDYEKVPYLNNDVKFLIIKDDKMQPYPNVKDTQDCLVSYSAKAAKTSCSDTFALATQFNNTILAGKVENPYGMTDMNPAGTTIPQSVLDYYRSYKNPKDGAFFDGSTAFVLNQEGFELVKGVAPILDAGGKVEVSYSSYFTKMLDLVSNCNTADKVPTYKDPAVSTDTGDGFAIVDVFKSGAKTCSFVVSIKNSKISFKVPREYHKCVKESDAMITNIEQKDADGFLISKKVSGTPDRFVANTQEVSPRIFASKENAEAVSALMSAMDTGAVSPSSLANAVSVSTADINFDKISSLDPTILKVVAICEWGVDPSNYAEDFQSFLADWNDMEGDVVSAMKGNNGGYYRAMYLHQLQNSKSYPNAAKLLAQVKSGAISEDDLWNWSSKGLAVCYMNYPTDWIDAFIIEYIKKGNLEDRSLIPSWYWNRDSVLLDPI